MPYIAQDDRTRFEILESEIASAPCTTAGELQYVIAVLINRHLQYCGNVQDRVRYQNYNDVMGALAGAQMEFYRRHVAPYEDICIERNGDV